MAPDYIFYLKDRTLDPLNACVDSAMFPAENEVTARKIAEVRFADQIAANPNLYVDFNPETDTYSKPFQPYVYVDDQGD